jgi:hypothetical protein
LDDATGLDRDVDGRDLGDRDRDRDGRDRDFDPRDVSLDGIQLPRRLDREVVLDGDERYELNGDDSRTLTAVGAFRVVDERHLQGRPDESGNCRSSTRPSTGPARSPLPHSVGRFAGAGVSYFHTIGTPVALTSVAFLAGLTLLPFGEETTGKPLPA